MTAHQMDLTLKHVDSPYIRGIGFLYLRYTGPPEEMWKWIQPYIYDEEEIKVEMSARPTTVGEFVRRLFAGRDFCGTTLPRLPILVERDLQVKLLQADKAAERAAFHFKNSARMAYFQTLGSKVMALYGDDENPVQWYKAEIDRIITRDEQTAAQLKYPRFVVSFPEYGNVETVTLGELDVLDGEWKHDRSVQESGRERQPSSERALYDEVRRRERDSVTANRNWARRPPSTKESVARAGYRRPDPEFNSHRQPSQRPNEPRGDSTTIRGESASAAVPKKRSQEEEAAIAEKRRRLAARYG
jgi:pre-mRNA-splicing factor 38B